MAYNVKQAARNSIAHRAAVALAEIEEADLRRDYFSAVYARQQEQVAVTDEQLNVLAVLLNERGLSDIEDDGSYDRAAYAKHLEALMTAQMQVIQMEELVQSRVSLPCQDDNALASTGSSHDGDATSDEGSVPFTGRV